MLHCKSRLTSTNRLLHPKCKPTYHFEIERQYFKINYITYVVPFTSYIIRLRTVR